MILITALLNLALAQSEGPPPEPVMASIDWQGHPAMHIPWPFFREGLTDRAPHTRYQHTFRQSVYAPYLERSGVRVFLAAAMAAERARNPTQARRLILEQLAFVEDFVARHSDRYAIGHSPDEVRALLHDTHKMVILHSIEGGHELLTQPGDAEFWASKGVVLMTLIHLRDDEFGGSGLLPMAVGPLINRAGIKAKRRGERRGLTEEGARAIVALDQAGILVDLSHMASEAIDDALAVTRANGIAPVVTHGHLASIRADEMSFTDEQVLEIYRQGGIFSLGLSAQLLDPIQPSLPIPPDLCPGTLETFRFHYEAVRTLLYAHADELVGADGPLSPEQELALSVGWSSDWNGWVSHSMPVYGRGRCRDLATLSDPLAVDTRGLADPSLLPEQWERLSREGMDLAPMLRSAERFLQLWDAAGD